MVIFEIFVLSTAIALASAGISQFYVNPYSHSFPVVQHSSVPLPLLHPQPFNAPFVQNQYLSFPQLYHVPPALVSRSLNPFVQQPLPIAQSLVNIGQSQARSNFARNLAASEPNSSGGTEYGFGYRTQYDDGASSMVVFVMGPESQKLEIARGKNVAARKLSSNHVGGPTLNEEKSEEVSNVLSNNNLGLNINNLLEVYPIFKDLEQPKTNIFHLYSHPANVFQLPTPNLSASSTPSTIAPSTSESSNDDDPESVAIEGADIGRSFSLENESTGGESTTQETKVQSNNVSSESSEEISHSSSTENSSESSSPSSTSTTTEESTEENSDTVESTTSQ